MISLDGEQLPGSDFKINASFDMPSDDSSGTSSYIVKKEKGIKPKTINVSLMLGFNQTEELDKLVKLAESIDDNGIRKIYTIGNDLAKGMKIRQVKFDGRFNVTEENGLKAWAVKFTLSEVKSVAEKQQEQLDETANQTATSSSGDAHLSVEQSFADAGLS
jgi:hypothetical protein